MTTDDTDLILQTAERSPRPPAQHSPETGHFLKGASGNPRGRPIGARNKSTSWARSILEQATGAITEKTVAVALEGHPLALKLCMERIMPRPRDATAAEVDLPPIATADDCGQAIDAILAAAAAGEITPAHAEALTNVVEKRMQSFKLVEFEQRLLTLEKALARRAETHGATP